MSRHRKTAMAWLIKTAQITIEELLHRIQLIEKEGKPCSPQSS